MKSQKRSEGLSRNLILLSMFGALLGACATAQPVAERPRWKAPQCIVVHRYVGETREQAQEKAAKLMTEPVDAETELLIRKLVEIENEKR